MRKRLDMDSEIADVGDLTRDELTAAWTKAYGCPPPKGVKRGLLERSAAWHLQAKRLGGLPSTVKKTLGTRIARRTNVNAIQPSNAGPGRQDGVPSVWPASSDKALTAPPQSPPPKVGSRLMREWNGRMHIVEVVDDGFVLDGKTYGSLSAVARRITGAHWSGPRFFGL
ncbi:DUF2924 domain-containing protein [Mesorhizobium sp. M00.F.Ca.ET.216.01.1.1]|uniref:DUF2924 domain-containing protein n=2 Tax=Mesorhizobium TaxID=68287 RepID=UPI000FDADC05|nr:DUF2924 domain-containing protein [Mesorhizobium sp. M00.F.Ca.ET.216.01.1.1]TIS55703.1 MAG: DUF2924 domain-containing protein [Mesorhizobium sp.]TIS86794.1 MAG: DUF2924 domain-containing protein [Mesorhizobium sp.]TJW47915.1 MAG: DUF2924 domain-containing protein [Mesorhizobium sp.]